METGISPNALLDTPPELFNAIVNYMRRRSAALNEATKRRK